MVDRISSNLLYQMLGSNILSNQNKVFKLSKLLAEGKKFTSPQEDPVGMIGSITTEGKIKSNDVSVNNRNIAKLDLNTQESAVSNIGDLIGKIYELSVKAGNDSASAKERSIYKNEIRALGENIIGLLNTKSGGNYIFSGQQTELPTISLAKGASFSTAIYKNGQDNTNQRIIDGLVSSVSIKDASVSTASTASFVSRVINPVASVSGNLDIDVNNGSGTVTSFSVAIASGDNISTIISKINAAFNAAGGLGSIATQAPAGYITMDTGLVSSNVSGGSAEINIKGSSNTSLTNGIGISEQKYKGKDPGILQVLANLETALNTNNGASIRALLDNIKSCSEQMNSVASQLGLYSSQADRFNDASEDLNLSLRSSLSRIQDLDMVDANVQYSNAQIALESSVRTASSLFSLSLSNFLS